MKRIYLIKLAMFVVGIFIASPGAFAAGCSDQFATTLVTYYEAEYELPPISQRDETAESICNIRTQGTRRFCTVRLQGALHWPFLSETTVGRWPTLIFNHGSEYPLNPYGKYCKVAKYFVPKGYIVFVPFRRGQGNPDVPNGKSSGKYIEDLLDDFENNRFHHNTSCLTRACYKAQLLKLQADEEIDLAVRYLTRTVNLVSQEDDGDYKLAVGGNSYGGAVTVFFNRKDHGQKAVMAFAPGAQNWGIVDFQYAAQDWNLLVDRNTLLGTLLNAARNAKKPAFYLQAKWDYDTRATIDLAYAHAYGGDDPSHGNRFMASIFSFEKPTLPSDKGGGVDYQKVHEEFAEATEEWGRSVRAFLIQYGVK
jgi:dienelactone hydrolase